MAKAFISLFIQQVFSEQLLGLILPGTEAGFEFEANDFRTTPSSFYLLNFVFFVRIIKIIEGCVLSVK